MAAIGPHEREAAEACPVDAAPASAAEARSWLTARVTPSVTSASVSRGVPSTSKGSVAPSGSSVMLIFSSNCRAPGSANDWCCANALPLKPNVARLSSRSATAVGSSTTS